MHVEDGEVVGFALDRGQGLLQARHDRRDLMAEIGQHVLEQHADQHLVLDHEDAALGCGWGCPVILLESSVAAEQANMLAEPAGSYKPRSLSDASIR